MQLKRLSQVLLRTKIKSVVVLMCTQKSWTDFRGREYLLPLWFCLLKTFKGLAEHVLNVLKMSRLKQNYFPSLLVLSVSHLTSALFLSCTLICSVHDLFISVKVSNPASGISHCDCHSLRKTDPCRLFDMSKM